MTFAIAILAAGAITSEVPSPTKPWWKDPHPMKAAVKTALPEKSILIDIKTQKLTALEFGEPVFSLRCCTGKNNATPRGQFPVRQKLRYNRALPKYGGAPIPFSLRLDIVKGGRRVPIAIHAYKSVPRVPSSHGCIRLTHTDAEKLFGWAEVGLPVLIR